MLARYRVEALPLLTEPPPFDHLDARIFPASANWSATRSSEPPFSRDNPPQITLVWRAARADPDDQLHRHRAVLDAAGQVIAQSDAVPGGRPTTGWRAGEYIVDPHTLAFNDTAAPGDGDADRRALRRGDRGAHAARRRQRTRCCWRPGLRCVKECRIG